jgi:hypothetical protein
MSGNSAGLWRVFVILIVDRNNIEMATDAIRAAIDGAADNSGNCVACGKINSERERPVAYPVMARARGGDEPLVLRGICRGGSSKHSHAGLRYRAREQFAH